VQVVLVRAAFRLFQGVGKSRGGASQLDGNQEAIPAQHLELVAQPLEAGCYLLLDARRVFLRGFG
jgi:hypothetical protein